MIPAVRHCRPRHASLAVVIVLLAVAGTMDAIALATDSTSWLEWRRLAELPDSCGPEGTILAHIEGAILVAGGAWAADSSASQAVAHSDSAFLLAPDAPHADAWRPIGRLPQPLAAAAVVPLDEGALVLGGTTPDGPTDQVFAIYGNRNDRNVRFDTSFPPLPAACSHAAVARLGNRVYLAGGRSPAGELKSFWVMELNQDGAAGGWQPLEAWPGEARSRASLVVQSNGDRLCLYLLGGECGGQSLRDAHRFDPARGAWSAIASLPLPVVRPAAAMGQSHVVVFESELLAYHAITDTWSVPERAGQVAAASALAPWGRGQAVLARDNSSADAAVAVYLVGMQPPRRYLKGLDFLALAIYLVLLALIGLYFSRREKSTEQFFLGGRTLCRRRFSWAAPWSAWVSCCSASTGGLVASARSPSPMGSSAWATSAAV